MLKRVSPSSKTQTNLSVPQAAGQKRKAPAPKGKMTHYAEILAYEKFSKLKYDPRTPLEVMQSDMNWRLNALKQEHRDKSARAYHKYLKTAADPMSFEQFMRPFQCKPPSFPTADFSIAHPFVDLSAFKSVPMADRVTYTGLHDFKVSGVTRALETGEPVLGINVMNYTSTFPSLALTCFHCCSCHSSGEHGCPISLRPRL